MEMPLVARGIMKLDLKVIDTKQSFPPLENAGQINALSLSAKMRVIM